MTFNLIQLTLFLGVLVALGFICRILAARGAAGAIAPLCLAVLSLGCFCLSAADFWQSYRLVNGMTAAEGVVVRVIVSSNTTARSGPNYGKSSDHPLETTSHSSPVVQFHPKGSDRMVEFTALGNRSTGYAVGEHVQLLYSPEAPEKAKLNLFVELWLPGIILALAGFILGVAAWATGMVWKKLLLPRTGAGRDPFQQ